MAGNCWQRETLCQSFENSTATSEGTNMRLSAWILVAISTAPAAAFAQSTSIHELVPITGARVRVTAIALGNDRQTGTLVSLSDDSLTFRPTGANNSIALSTPTITQLEVSRGTHTHKAMGALIGFVVVGGTAAVITAATWKPTSEFDFGRGGDAAIVAVPLGLVGALIGTAIGAHHTESWASVPIPRE
jgi:hypothetical protein